MTKAGAGIVVKPEGRIDGEDTPDPGEGLCDVVLEARVEELVRQFIAKGVEVDLDTRRRLEIKGAGQERIVGIVGFGRRQIGVDLCAQRQVVQLRPLPGQFEEIAVV